MPYEYVTQNNNGERLMVDEADLLAASKQGFHPIMEKDGVQLQVHTSDAGEALKQGFAPIRQPLASKTESAVRGAAQGASFGFADEIQGGVEAGAKALFGDEKLVDIGKNYAKHRDEARSAYRAAEEANPATYTLGELGGAGATSLIPGLGAAKGALTAPEAIGRMARIGMFQGLGSSEANTVSGLAADAGESALMGGATAGAGKLIGKLAQKGGVLQHTTQADVDKASRLWQRGTTGLTPTMLIGEAAMTGGIPTASIANYAAKKAVEKYGESGLQNIGRFLSKIGDTHYAPILKDAAARGMNAFAVTHFLLQRNDPNYRTLFKEENGD